jgi:hypothetical protein
MLCYVSTQFACHIEGETERYAILLLNESFDIHQSSVTFGCIYLIFLISKSLLTGVYDESMKLNLILHETNKLIGLVVMMANWLAVLGLD